MTEPERSAEAGAILLLDQDERLRADLTSFLARHGFDVRQASDIAAAEAALHAAPIDVVVLGAPACGGDVLTFCRRIIEQTHARVIMVSAQASELDRVLGLEFGADDYLGKPFSQRELLARVRAIRRRQALRGGQSPAPHYVFDVFVLDVGRRELRGADGRALALQAGVMELLQVFAEHPGRILSREDLIATAGLPPSTDGRAIDMRVSRVRQTLRALGGRDLIRTVRGSGYVLDADASLWRGPGTPPAR